MRELPKSTRKISRDGARGAVFGYSSSDRIEDRATLESDSSANPEAGRRRKSFAASVSGQAVKAFILTPSEKLRGAGQSPGLLKANRKL